MCIIAVSFKTHAEFPLIIAANRDEFYVRKTEVAHIWQDAPHILAGRDAEQGGTWLGVSKTGRFVAITNFRNPSLREQGTYSRGQIATDFLNSEVSAKEFAQDLQQKRHLYGPFNVLLFDGAQLFHYNNIIDTITKLQPGIHGLSNATVNTPWPKVELLKSKLAHVFADPSFSDDDLFTVLTNRTKAPDEALPSTGVPLELERNLSAIFIHFAGYGTRCSTVIRLTNTEWQFTERTYENSEHVCSQQFVFPIKKR